MDLRKKSIFEYDSWIDWPSVVLMTGVHGNEHSGILALQNLINDDLSLKKWKLTVIFANIDAIEKNIRFVDVNMNRSFWEKLENTKEEARIKELLPYLNQADILLDLHNTIDLSSFPFLITEAESYACVFDVQYVLSWIDSVQKWWSDGYMTKLWKIWLCLECGSIVDDINVTTNYAYNMSINLLCYLGLIDGIFQSYSSHIVLKPDFMHISQSESFRLKKPFREFELCKKWQIIWYDNWNQILAPYDGYILFARNRNKKWEECFLYVK